MVRVGAAGENAAMKSFFALRHENVLNRSAWRTREELQIAIVVWLERTYHRRRRHARLGWLTPIEFETIMDTPDALATWLHRVAAPYDSSVGIECKFHGQRPQEPLGGLIPIE